MALSTCSKCNKTQFELKVLDPKGSKYKVNVVQCASCGAVIGVLPFENPSYAFKQQNKAIKAISNALKVRLQEVEDLET